MKIGGHISDLQGRFLQSLIREARPRTIRGEYVRAFMRTVPSINSAATGFCTDETVAGSLFPATGLGLGEQGGDGRVGSHRGGPPGAPREALRR